MNNRFNNLTVNHVNLPRTGIEQPFMRDRPKFKETHKEFEATYQVNVSVYRINCDNLDLFNR
jgi:hypothetical protein